MTIERRDNKVFWQSQDGDLWAINFTTAEIQCLISNKAVKTVCRTVAFLGITAVTVLGTEAPAQVIGAVFRYGLRGSILP
jgi:hypothetical protein